MKISRVLALALMLTAPALGCSSSEEPATGDEQNLTERSAVFEVVHAAADGRWYVQLLAGGGEVLLRSNGYASESSAKSGAATLKKNAVTASRYVMEETKDGAWYVALRGGNGQVIAAGEPQASESKATAVRDWVLDLMAVGAVVRGADGAQGAETFRCGKAKKQHCFRVRDEGGEVLLQSQRYSSKSAADTGLASVRKNGLRGTQYTYDDGADGKRAWYRLHASSAVEIEAQEVIGWSPVQASREVAYDAVAALRAVLAHDGNDGGCHFATVADEYLLDVEREDLVYGDVVELTPDSDFSSIVHDQMWAQVGFYFPGPDNDEQDVFVWFDDSIRMREIRDPATQREYRAFEFSYDSVYSTIFPVDSAETIELTAVDGQIDSCEAQEW